MADSYVNLRQIVKDLHKEDIEGHKSPEDRLKKVYDTENERLLEVLTAVNFCVDLIKNDRGEYRIPVEDRKLIEWILQEYKTPQMKSVRRRAFGEVDIRYVYQLLEGLNQMMLHLDLDDLTRRAQLELMHSKTDYHIGVRMWNVQFELMQLLNDVNMYMKLPVFNLGFENKIEYLDTLGTFTEEYAKKVRQEFSRIWKEREAYVKARAIPITWEELQFSQRTLGIIEVLYNNEEYVKLKDELKELSMNKGFFVDYDKERVRIQKRLVEILNEESSKFPIEVDKMTKIEKIMCLADNGFTVQLESGTNGGYVTFDVDNSDWERFFI